MSRDSRIHVAAEGVPFSDRKEMGFVYVLADVGAIDTDRRDIDEQFAFSRYRVWHLPEPTSPGP